MDNEQMRESMEALLGNMDVLKRVTEMNACLAKVAYDTLIAAGFTEEQAFELVARKGVTLG